MNTRALREKLLIERNCAQLTELITGRGHNPAMRLGANYKATKCKNYMANNLIQPFAD